MKHFLQISELKEVRVTMGKMTGFLDYERETSREAAPQERIKNWNEFHIPLREEEQKKQGARCMDCGVPFCQSGIMIKGKMCIRDSSRRPTATPMSSTRQ